MRVSLFPFQKKALINLRIELAEAMGSYGRTHTPQVISFTAPTGAGKTIIMASLIETIFFGDENFFKQPDAIVIWLSDSPQLNEQSKQKIDGKADKIRLGQCITVAEDSFDQQMFDEGHIYFLNTQKLSKSSNLTKHGDTRTYTIWQTIANTVKEKSDKLYFIIDEAHRGMQGREAGRATSIMQKFLKGSEEDGIGPMPVVIGMSATSQRFNDLVADTVSTMHFCKVTENEVRASGLLKDRIIISYPDDDAVNKDMAILQAAADNWKDMWEHWNQYCFEQHYAYVYPVFLIQVLNGTGGKLTDTDLADCINKIEERIGFRFKAGQVVHTFGQTSSAITINGLDIPYVEPSAISDNRDIRVVFFKENLSTGWDCPRAETMMSFKHANDATYIAQLLGRMVRTPMQMHINVDEVLNDVHLFLPYFNEETVKKVVEAFQSAEGGSIPTDIYGEKLTGKQFTTLTVKTKKKTESENPNQINLFGENFQGVNVAAREKSVPSEIEKGIFSPAANENTNESNTSVEKPAVNTGSEGHKTGIDRPMPSIAGTEAIKLAAGNPSEPKEAEKTGHVEIEQHAQKVKSSSLYDTFDREAVMRFINDAGLLSYDVRSLAINKYLDSLLQMAYLLNNSKLDRQILPQIKNEVADIIRGYVEELKISGQYDELVTKVKQFKLSNQIFDAFGTSVDNYSVHELWTTTDTDIDRQFDAAENRLYSQGIGKEYGKRFAEDANPYAYKIDVILFVANDECMEKLNAYAKSRFHALNDKYRRLMAKHEDESIRKQYDDIVSNGDKISKHNFRLPETINVPNDNDGKEYADHLFVNEDTGIAKLKLNGWEEGVVAEEEEANDFVCWIRNPQRKAWALCIPYEFDGAYKATYPDLIIVRKDEQFGSGYIIDILEPHGSQFADNLGKAKGFAEYARQNPGLGRIQLIREVKDALGRKRFKRLDMGMSAIRDLVSHAMSIDELDHIFDVYGFFAKN